MSAFADFEIPSQSESHRVSRLHYGTQHHDLATMVERRRASQQNRKEDAARPKIRWFRVAGTVFVTTTLEHFGRHVNRRPTQNAQLLIMMRLDAAGKAKIGQFNVEVVVDENIFQFNIAMDNVVLCG